jgi:hypothetical protein
MATGKNEFTKENQERKDEYKGKYKSASEGMSEADKWGTNTPLLKQPQPADPWKGLKKVGG